MNLELTDAKRYELELENILSVILAANRRGHDINENGLAQALCIDLPTTNKLIQKLQTDNIIK